MVISDLCISLGIPVLVMDLRVCEIIHRFLHLLKFSLLDYIVQPHRYDILEDIGCHPATYNTLPAYFLVFMWPILLSLISFIYFGNLACSAIFFHPFYLCTKHSSYTACVLAAPRPVR